MKIIKKIKKSKKIKKNKKKDWLSKKDWKKLPKNKLCSRAKECGVDNCPHFMPHRRHSSCKVKICSALTTPNKNCHCRLIKEEKK